MALHVVTGHSPGLGPLHFFSPSISCHSLGLPFSKEQGAHFSLSRVLGLDINTFKSAFWVRIDLLFTKDRSDCVPRTSRSTIDPQMIIDPRRPRATLTPVRPYVSVDTNQVRARRVYTLIHSTASGRLARWCLGEAISVLAFPMISV